MRSKFRFCISFKLSHYAFFFPSVTKFCGQNCSLYCPHSNKPAALPTAFMEMNPSLKVFNWSLYSLQNSLVRAFNFQTSEILWSPGYRWGPVICPRILRKHMPQQHLKLALIPACVQALLNHKWSCPPDKNTVTLLEVFICCWIFNIHHPGKAGYLTLTIEQAMPFQVSGLETIMVLSLYPVWSWPQHNTFARFEWQPLKNGAISAALRHTLRSWGNPEVSLNSWKSQGCRWLAAQHYPC